MEVLSVIAEIMRRRMLDNRYGEIVTDDNKNINILLYSGMDPRKNCRKTLIYFKQVI